MRAAGVGFEPTGRLRAQRFSRPPRSTAPAPRQADSLPTSLASGRVATRLGGWRLTAALASLGLATFAYVTTENLPVGLLPQLAAGLHRSRAATGYLVTGYAAVVVVTSVPLALATRRFSRRRLLLGSLSLFVVCTALGAAAQTYGQLLATRMAIALSHAVFWAIVAAAGAALVPRARR